jgi:RNA polymerase primary sigma factor
MNASQNKQEFKLDKQNETTVRRLEPTAKMPSSLVLRRLDERDIDLLESRLASPIECIYHSCFRKSTLPGAESERAPDTSDFARPADASTISLDIELAAPKDVLTAEQEQVLFLRFNYCRYRMMRVLRKFRGKRLDAAATRELLHWEHRAQEYRTDIVRANTSLVLAMARRSRNNGVELSELVSEGNLALLRCVDKFDAARGFKFSTYACRAILASFSRAGSKSARYRSQFPAPYDPAMERSDYLETKRQETEYDCVQEIRRILFENTADLSTVERQVLDARFSLNRTPKPGERRMTLDQVGSRLGVSKERVRQIQNQAMIKLRAALEDRLLAAS